MTSRWSAIVRRNRDIAAVVLATALILLVPLVAMQFTDDVDWNAADFVVAAILLAGTGIMYTLAARRMRSAVYRIIAGGLLATALVCVWAQLAVGIIGAS